MKVYNDLSDLPDFQKAVVTIGSFDGVHLGHQQILQKVNALARETGGESIVITFHPHPRLVIYPKDQSLRLLNTIDEKVQLLEKYGVDNVVVVPFTIEFSQQSADEYIRKFLVQQFHPRYIVIGYDHRFGLNRQGDINYLRWHGDDCGYEVVEIEKETIEDIAISSTKIRDALEAGDVRRACQLMGHPFSLTGTVVHGQNIGAGLGFPTANLEVPQQHKLVPPDGIYAVEVTHQEESYGGMLYIGTRPTLKKYSNRTIEVNIFEFNKQIYGDKLRLDLIDFIRKDSDFPHLDALREQLQQDRQQALTILQNRARTGEKKKTTPEPTVAVVILNYNGRHYLQQFLPSVLAGAYPNFRVIVADNGSTDDSLAFLAEHYGEEVECIDLAHNYGFAGGYNRALEQVRDAQYFVLLNSDIEVTPDWMTPIIELMERDPTVAACQPKVKSYQQKDYFEYAGAAGGWIDALGYPFCRGRIFAHTEMDRGQYDDTEEIFWATGAAFFIRTHLFRALGGFDEDYFAHSEEIDLCWRLKAAGFKIMVRPRSVVYHVGGGTLAYNTPNKTYLNFRNSLYTLLKNEPGGKLLWLLPLRLILDGVAGLLFLVQGKFAHIGSILRAHWSFFPKFPQLLRKRRAYQERIQRVSISQHPNEEGRYRGSIVWQYYARGRRSFRNLK